jgi:hypothetical protein
MRRATFVASPPPPLEKRITPSHSGLTGAASTPIALTQSLSLNLYGLALGRDTTVGTEHRLRVTSATISPLGKLSLTGVLMIPKKSGVNIPVHGKVTISNAQGTVTVDLIGSVTVYKGPFTFASGNLTYTIVSGTKADRGVIGSGPVLYGPGPVFQPDRFLLNFGNYPPPP